MCLPGATLRRDASAPPAGRPEAAVKLRLDGHGLAQAGRPRSKKPTIPPPFSGRSERVRLCCAGRAANCIEPTTTNIASKRT